MSPKRMTFRDDTTLALAFSHCLAHRQNMGYLDDLSLRRRSVGYSQTTVPIPQSCGASVVHKMPFSMPQGRVTVLNDRAPGCPGRNRRGPVRCRAAAKNTQQKEDVAKIGKSGRYKLVVFHSFQRVIKPLFPAGVEVSSLGIGIWSWGDR